MKTSVTAVWSLLLTLFLFLQNCLAAGSNLAISDDTFSSRGPLWRQLFQKYRTWMGVYEYKTQLFHCTLNIYSVQDSANGTIIATLEDQNYAVIDMEGVSHDDRIITFTSITIFNATENFPMHTTVILRGVLEHYHDFQVYWYDANFTSPSNQGFTAFRVMAKLSSEVNSSHRSSSNVNIGLAIGIPTSLALILSITGIGLVIWAVKKGYIRHVARNYRRFGDPPSDVKFESNSGGAVHI